MSEGGTAIVLFVVGSETFKTMLDPLYVHGQR
jgi:hypothetical protein